MSHLMIVSLHRGSPDSLERHIDHAAHTVSYVTDPAGARLVAPYRDRIAALAVVDPDDGDATMPAAEAIFRRLGYAEVVFAPSEHDLLTAARIRDRFGIPGLSEAQTLNVRDKVRMKQRLHAAGVAAPRFAPCSSPHEVRRLVRDVGFPLVLKPRQGAGSRGVRVVEDEHALWAFLDSAEVAGFECEEFVPGPILHVDGLIHGGRLIFCMVSRYVNTCLESAHGAPHGSVVVDDLRLSATLRDFASRSLAALGLDDSAFHLEVILRDGVDPVFLEVGGRLGGGEIKPMVQDLYQVDLLREWVNTQLGTVGELAAPPPVVGGWLVVPQPCPPPYRVMAVSSPKGCVPCLYHETVPRLGATYDRQALSEDRWPGGRFRYRGETTEEVEHAIRETIRLYRLEARRADTA